MEDRISIRLKYDRNNNIPETIIQKLGSLINRNYRLFCIVEGKTDIAFYSNLKDIDLNSDTFYIYSKQNKNDAGKDAVISSYNKIKNNKNFNRYMNKYVFIVDHDYAGLMSSKYDIEEETNNKFSITKPYSFENYFLTPENIKKIFYFLNISNDYQNFINLYNQFGEEIKDFTRLKSSTIIVGQKQSEYYDKNCKIYSKKYSYEEIFDFKFEQNELKYNRELLDEEIAELRNYIDETPSVKKIYDNYSYNLVKNNDFIRGHNAFAFLRSYLYQIHNIKLNVGNNDKYKNIVNRLDVDIEFRNGLGERL